MKWRMFLTLCISSFFVSFPQNIIGCGGGDFDSYDYYTSFFNPDISDNKALSPFYYTHYAMLYNAEEQVSTADVLAEEWKNYCGGNVTIKDAKAFVMGYSLKDISKLYTNIEKGKPQPIPDSVQRNSMTKYFTEQKDLEALGYILFAKKAEPYVIGNSDYWEPQNRDSLAMAKMIKNGQQLYSIAKKDIFKLKYAYQMIRLAHYNGSYDAAIKYYDDYVVTNSTQSVLQPLSLALKAGALYRKGNKTEAVYLFSKAFNATDAKKVSNYISFGWALGGKMERNDYLQLCKNNEEKAGLLALFAMGSEADESKTIEEINKLYPGSKNIEILVAREINKLESKYYSPLIGKEKGGGNLYYNYYKEEALLDSVAIAEKNTIQNFILVLAKLSDLKTQSAAMFCASAAYCSLMIKDYANAREYLASAKKMQQSAKVNDQLMLTKLLLSINEYKVIDAKAEEELLPSLKWLLSKAENGSKLKTNDGEISQWKIFYRNIVNVALAKKYHAQGDLQKEALCVGNSSYVFDGGSYSPLDFLRNQMDTKDVEKLFTLMNSKTNSSYENYLIKNNEIKIPAVVEFAATAYLRSYDYTNAIVWLKKNGATKKDTIFKSAFIELIGDVEERLPTERKTTSKLLFAEEMLATQKLLETDKPNAAKYYYKMATGMYNITYYGHAWELVQYNRSGSDGYAIPKGATEFQKQYYGCYAAHDMYKKAMDASTDKNFKGKCLFMMAKCSQKSVGKPNYFDVDYDKYEIAEKEFWPKFKNNKYFPQLINEYSGTKFYEEAFSKCSYLRDFEFKQKNK